MGDELCEMGVLDLARLYRRGEVSPVEVVSAHLGRSARLNPVLNAFLLLLPEASLEAARAVEGLFRARVDLGPLQGVPVSVKDLIQVSGTRTTAGSRVLLSAPLDQRDAVVVQRLRAAGAVIIGKTNLHEFASGDPEPDGSFGLVQNPRRIGYHPGSSSSGAAAAVAAGLGVIALGTDTGGSIRIPAYLCGVSGIKPTTGWISLDGIIPLSSSLDSVGPLARRVTDVALALRACAGQNPDTCDGNPWGMDFQDQLELPVQGWRVGVPKGQFFSKAQPAVTTAFEKTLKILDDLGCQLIDFDPPGIEGMPELCSTIIRSEGAAYHERYREQEHLYGPSFRERILMGREIRAVAYVEARRQQLELQQKWLKLQNRFDFLVAPTGAAVAPAHGVSTIEIGGKHFPFRELLGRFTRPFNLLGWPALSIPNGVDAAGLPTGVQIAGPAHSENRLLLLGYQLEKSLGLVEKLGIEPRNPK